MSNAIGSTCFAILSAGLLASCAALTNPETVSGRIIGTAASVILPGGGQPPAQSPTREQILRTGLAAIALGPEPSKAAIMFAHTQNGDFVTYANQPLQQIILQGGLVTGTRALGYDLLGVYVTEGDPIAEQSGQYASQLGRGYVLPSNDPKGEILTVTCEQQIGKNEVLDILGLKVETTQLIENCEGDAQFTNQYWMDKQGLIWKSVQWAGPNLPPLHITVLEPLTE